MGTQPGQRIVEMRGSPGLGALTASLLRRGGRDVEETRPAKESDDFRPVERVEKWRVDMGRVEKVLLPPIRMHDFQRVERQVVFRG